MRILIAADMEGVTGVVHWEQVTAGLPEYGRFRRLMTEDVNAAVSGAFAGGAGSVDVADGHGGHNRNILIEELDARARLYSGETASLGGLEGLSGDVAGVMLIGYHARAGTLGAVLDHTYSSPRIANLSLDGELIGEIGMSALVAGHFGVPIILVSGDQAACDEAVAKVGSLEQAAVKRATGRYSAECLAPPVAHARIEEAARRAVSTLPTRTADPLLHAWPADLALEFVHTEQADRASVMHGAVRHDARTVCIAVDDALRAYGALKILLALGAAYVPPTDAR